MLKVLSHAQESQQCFIDSSDPRLSLRFVSGKPKKNSECIDLTYARKDIQEHNRTHKKPFINPPTPLAARGAAGGACQRKNYKQRGGKKHSSPSRCLGLAGPQFWTLASSLFRKQRCGPKDSVRPSLSSCLGLASF